MFVIRSIVCATSRMLYEPNDIVYDGDFSKIVNKVRDFPQDILDSITCSVEGPIGLQSAWLRYHFSRHC